MRRVPSRSLVMALTLTWFGCTVCEPTVGSNACPDSTPVANCPNDLPTGCTEPAPSYQTAVAPLFNSYCLTCHSAGGQQASLPLGTYEEIDAIRSEVLDQIYSCSMPLPGEPQPTTVERQILLQWFVCGAPNN